MEDDEECEQDDTAGEPPSGLSLRALWVGDVLCLTGFCAGIEDTIGYCLKHWNFNQYVIDKTLDEVVDERYVYDIPLKSVSRLKKILPKKKKKKKSNPNPNRNPCAPVFAPICHGLCLPAQLCAKHLGWKMLVAKFGWCVPGCCEDGPDAEDML
eukprot:CAMPEP_0119325480 /NCGR_PEP_ID=MMETSP1333-20130426/65928_1 /TAXON_ID=418940 /ORGANISM="Scyphosphaera apsteinii, Strain RCC1455" /LENGTH=153 /DNA_ID=CAMNT_0007333477 /DNA_START=354 /DNA_END=815 /DNA_ORIENTATION=-